MPEAADSQADRHTPAATVCTSIPLLQSLLVLVFTSTADFTCTTVILGL